MRSFRAAVVSLVFLAVTSAHAAVITYTGFDDGATAPGTNSTTARNNFLAAVGSATVIDFESTSLGDSTALSIAAGVTTSAGGTVTDLPSCDPNLCGDNTTAAGARFLEIPGSTLGTLTFTFLTPINSFGAYFGGLQVSTTTLNFDDGTSQSILLAPGATVAAGGFGFVGFTDFGAAISSISIDAVNDILTVDDILYTSIRQTEIPEPSSFAMLAIGLAAVVKFGRRTQGR
jgi:hypothetical protein